MIKIAFESPLVAAFLAALIAGQAACSGAPGTAGGGSPTSSAAAAHATYTGEELFRGIFFGQGDVAEKLPELWETAARRSAKEISRAANPEELAFQLTQMSERVAATDPTNPAVTQLRTRAEVVRAMSPKDAAAMLQAARENEAAATDMLVAYVRKASPTYFDALKAAIEKGDPVAISRLADQGRDLICDGIRVTRGPTPQDLWVETETAIYAVAVVAVFVAAVAAVLVEKPQDESALDAREVAIIADHLAVH